MLICFFLPHHFYSSLKNTAISKADYDAVKKLYQTMKRDNLGELNKLYFIKIQLSFARYLNSVQLTFKKYLNLTLKNVILLVLLVAVSIEKKINV